MMPPSFPAELPIARGRRAAHFPAASFAVSAHSGRRTIMVLIVDNDTSTQDDRDLARPMARWGAVLAFMLIYIVSYIDRQVLTIVVDPVKASLGMGDTEIGL